MPYLNCPFCPSQAVPANTQDMARVNLTKLRCIGNGHESYVHTTEIYGDERSEREPESIPSRFDRS